MGHTSKLMNTVNTNSPHARSTNHKLGILSRYRGCFSRVQILETYKCRNPSTLCSRVRQLYIHMNTFLTAVLYSLQQLLRQNSDAIANSIVLEQGKTLAGMVSINNF